MLSKLFGYDFRTIGKSLWIFTVAVAVTTACGCGSGILLHNFKITAIEGIPDIVVVTYYAFLGIVILASFISLFVYGVLSLIMIVKHYYTNLFTDEGYLTFTLPAKASTILNAKLLSSCLWYAIAGIVSVMLTVGLVVCVYTPEFVWGLFDFFVQSFIHSGDAVGISVTDYIVFALEYIVIVISSITYELFLIFLCITIASIIVKKAKVILGIGIFYGANSVIGSVVSVVSMLISVFSTALLVAMFEYFGNDLMNVLSLEMHIQYIFIILVYVGVSVGAYFLNRNLVKNKLNLP